MAIPGRPPRDFPEILRKLWWPLDKALIGDSTELAANIPRAFGMFTGQGDTTVRDNWPNRPVFPEPISQLLFLGGAIVALSRLRQPRYVLAVLWIGVMLIPTIVTTGAPNFTRALGALPMAFALPGFMVEWLCSDAAPVSLAVHPPSRG
jgi:hypothetical protein